MEAAAPVVGDVRHDLRAALHGGAAQQRAAQDQLRHHARPPVDHRLGHGCGRALGAAELWRARDGGAVGRGARGGICEDVGVPGAGAGGLYLYLYGRG
jgi:hypothetical protein